MDKPIVLAIVLTLLVWGTVVTGLFNYNLPHWCATPNGQGNQIIQPLCK